MSSEFLRFKIQNLLRKGDLIIWGCGSASYKFLNEYPQLADNISYFVDSDSQKIGKLFRDKWNIKSPDILNSESNNVIVTPALNSEIVNYLEKKGFIYLENCVFYSDILQTIYPKSLLDIKNALIDFKNTRPEIKLLICKYPTFPTSNFSEYEMNIKKNNLWYNDIVNNPTRSKSLMDTFKSEDRVREVLSPPKSYYDPYGVRRFEDTKGNLVNTSNGHRITLDQPENAERTIYFLPNCIAFGVGASDKGTIASQLQELFNTFVPEYRMKVENYSFFLWENSDGVRNFKREDSVSLLNSLPIKNNDIIFFNIFNDTDLFSDILELDLSKFSSRPHNYGELFFDQSHFTENGNRLVAKKIFEYLQFRNFFEDDVANNSKSNQILKRDYGNAKIVNDELKESLESYKVKISELKPKIGSIVMNCNPFTLGHRYLIEYAVSQVTHLIIFVVEEDKSIFTFSDRLELVKKGVSDLRNVSVIPSGQFIISSLTFSEYFNKSEMQDRMVDSSLDVNIFAREIAPCLNINVRFVGEEPFDRVTRQYNDTLRAILPNHGIELVEIPRKEFNGSAISASRVRRLIDDKNFDEIGKIVPPTTLEYLKKKFS